jgi:hypothetical protein
MVRLLSIRPLDEQGGFMNPITIVLTERGRRYTVSKAHFGFREIATPRAESALFQELPKIIPGPFSGMNPSSKSRKRYLCPIQENNPERGNLMQAGGLR